MNKLKKKSFRDKAITSEHDLADSRLIHANVSSIHSTKRPTRDEHNKIKQTVLPFSARFWYLSQLDKNSEYDQEIPQSQTADNPMALSPFSNMHQLSSRVGEMP